MTKNAPWIFASVLMMLGACTTTQISSSETERALCDEWGKTLILPSRQDTIETARALNQAQAVHREICL